MFWNPNSQHTDAGSDREERRTIPHLLQTEKIVSDFLHDCLIDLTVYI